MSNLSKQATDLIKRADRASDVFNASGEEVVDLAQKLLDDTDPDGQAGSVVGFLSSTLSLVLARKEVVLQTDKLVVQEGSEDATALNNRESIYKATRTHLIRLRNSLDGTYGKSLLVALGLNGPLPDNPEELHRIMQHARALLTDPVTPFSMPEPLDEFSPSWTADNLAKRLLSLYGPLAESVAEVTKELRETQDARRKRRIAMDELQRAIVTFNAIFEQLARLVGRDDVAERIRPKGGRPKPSAETSSTTTTEAPSS